MMSAEKTKSIPEFFSGKSVFVTGGTGFIGKVLVEKLLRSCPGIKNIYILVRDKKGLSPEKRVLQITNVKLFDKLKKENPDAIQKLIPVTGNIEQLRLGLSEKDEKTLQENVNFIFHVAASIRFDDFLHKAIITNVRATREVSKLALKLKKCDVFVHVSTMYCNSDRGVVDECIYPPFMDWRKTIQLAEEGDPHVTEVLTNKCIHPLPNTYTFTKQLAEHVVYDMCYGKVPVVIYRPAVVICALDDPIEGWVDSLGGPTGLLIAGGFGVLRVAYGRKDLPSQYVAVDFVARSIIVAAWNKGTTGDLNEVSFYNGTMSQTSPLSIRDIYEIGVKLIWDVPCTQLLWYPRIVITSCFFYFYLQFVFCHLFPALLVDLILLVTGKKPMLWKIQRKIYIANCVMSHFVFCSWIFTNGKCYGLEEKIMECDKEAFSFIRYRSLSLNELQRQLGSGKKILAESMLGLEFDKEKGYKTTYRFWLLDICTKTIMFALLLWLMFTKFLPL